MKKKCQIQNAIELGIHEIIIAQDPEKTPLEVIKGKMESFMPPEKGEFMINKIPGNHEVAEYFVLTWLYNNITLPSGNRPSGQIRAYTEQEREMKKYIHNTEHFCEEEFECDSLEDFILEIEEMALAHDNTTMPDLVEVENGKIIAQFHHNGENHRYTVGEVKIMDTYVWRTGANLECRKIGTKTWQLCLCTEWPNGEVSFEPEGIYVEAHLIPPTYRGRGVS